MNQFERLEKILALLEAHPEGISGEELAVSCGVSWDTMRKDLHLLSFSSESTVPLYTDYDDLDNEHEDENDSGLFKPQVKWFLAAPRRYTPVHLNLQEAASVLEALEYLPEDQALNAQLRQKIISGFDLGETDGAKHRLVKGSTAALPLSSSDLFFQLEKAVHQSLKTVIFMHGRKSMVEPLGLVYYSRLRNWYLACKEQGVIKTFNLKNIREVKFSSEKFERSEGFSLEEWLEPRWGMEFGELLAVKVRFFDRAQTIAKARKDTAHRIRGKMVKQPDNSYLYTDQIIGRNEFLSWVLGFGSAAEILEPSELRLELKQRILETVRRYKNS